MSRRHPAETWAGAAADIMTGDLVVREGDVLTPSRIGALAAIGRTEVTVYAKPRVAILSTGNEVVEPGRPLKAGQVYDVNRFTLAAIVEAHGGEPRSQKAATDTLESLSAALDACVESDLIVFSGGSSVGTRDLVVDLVAARGEMIFHGIAVRPGKPTAFALVETSNVKDVGPVRPDALLRDARQSDVVPLERVHPAHSLSRAPSRGFRRTRRGPSASRSADGSPPRRDAISSTRCGLRTVRHSRPSKDRATSPACPRPTATSRFQPTRMWWTRERR